MDNKISIDYLSSLPSELLLEIFQDCGIVSGPLSKPLLPFTRPAIFKDVHIKTIELFVIFFRTIIKNPSAGKLVKTIKLVLNYIGNVDVTFKKDFVLKGLQALSTVYHFETNLEQTATIITSPDIKKLNLLPQLQSLVLIDPFKSRKNPWSREHFRNLSCYPDLIKLSLKSDLTEKELEEWDSRSQDQVNEEDLNKETQEQVAGTDSKGNDYNNNITDLDISSSLEDSYLIDTVLMFKKITILRISTNFSDGHGILEVLEEINLEIVELHIYDPPNYSNWYPLRSSLYHAHIYPSITRFTKLKKLTISESVFSSDIFQYLRDPLPLESLTFGYDCHIDISNLKRLLLPGPAKLSALRILTLDVVEGEIAPERVIEFGPDYDEDTGEFSPHWGWILPYWREGRFDKELLKALISLVDRYGVEVNGTSVHAIEVQEEWEKEVELVEAMGRDIRGGRAQIRGIATSFESWEDHRRFLMQ